MTGQFYKTPKGFPFYYFSKSRKPLGGFFVLLGRKQSSIPTSGLRFTLRGSAGHAFFLLAGNCLAFPKYTPHPVQSNIWFRLHFWSSQKGAEQAEKAGKIVKETS